MKNFEKILDVLAKNLGITIVLVAAIILFAIFSDGLVPGLITAFSALLGYTCIEMLYKEFKKSPAKSAPAKKPAAKKSAKKK